MNVIETRNAWTTRWQNGNSRSFEIIQRVKWSCTGLQKIKREARARMGVLYHQRRQQVTGAGAVYTRFSTASFPIWPIPRLIGIWPDWRK